MEPNEAGEIVENMRKWHGRFLKKLSKKIKEMSKDQALKEQMNKEIEQEMKDYGTYDKTRA